MAGDGVSLAFGDVQHRSAPVAHCLDGSVTKRRLRRAVVARASRLVPAWDVRPSISHWKP
jgi:hypothetical protein